MLDQRKFQRFDIKLPLELVKLGSRRTSATGETRNLSSGGVLFATAALVEVGEPIEYVISLPANQGAPVRLRCLGKVVRREDTLQTFAATLERYEFIRTV